MRVISLLSFLLFLSGCINKPAPFDNNEYNIVWDTQSENSMQSMPCGGAGIGLNVWVEKNDLLILIGSPDSWVEREDGSHKLAKLGRLRLSFDHPVYANGFRQAYHFPTNSIQLEGRDPEGRMLKMKIWVDADQPVVHIEGSGEIALKARAALEIWRGEGRFTEKGVHWFYRNDNPAADTRKLYIRKRNLEDIRDSIPDLLHHLTFGGSFSGDQFQAAGADSSSYGTQPCMAYRLETKQPLCDFKLQATLRTAQDSTVEAFFSELAVLEKNKYNSITEDWEKNRSFWEERWENSYIRINPGRDTSDLGWKVGRNYQLFRAILAANNKGRFPTLFNGGIFTCEEDPEARRWEWSEFMGQNQRLVYWPLLKSGDADLLEVALDFYKQSTPASRGWAKHFWGIEGNLYPEDMNIFGLPCYDNTPAGHSSPSCLSYHYVSSMEFALMMLERTRYSGREIQPYLPSIEGILKGYDAFYRKQCLERTGKELDQNDLYVFYPGNGAELYTECMNEVTSIAGLTALADGLLGLPDEVYSKTRKEFVRAFRDRLPPISQRYIRGHRTISPAASWLEERAATNMEMPHLYPIFPFGIYGVGKPDLELARDTWSYGYYKPEYQRRTFCWYQGNIFTARLGLTQEAKEYALAKFLYPLKEEKKQSEAGEWFDADLTPNRTRFPAFWDTGTFCQSPDMDHGGSAMVGLQEMLMQAENFLRDDKGGFYGDKIYLFPAWPRDWDVDFKLHAPLNTVVECSLRKGKVEYVNVTPQWREKDVIIMLGNK